MTSVSPPPSPSVTGGDGAVMAAPDRATVDLLGVLAYGELSAFDRLAEDARRAPTLAGRAALASMAAAEIGHYRLLEDHLRDRGVAIEEAMAPFVVPLDSFHDSTRAGTWLEGLVKAYVGDGLATDFYREVAAFLPAEDRDLVLEVLADTGHADFAVREVRAAIAADRRVAGRLALWARRLVGEALTQSQAVIAERDGLADLLISGTGDLNGVADLLQRLTAAHTVRMGTLGLNG